MKTLRNSALIAAMLLVVQMTLGQDKPQITKPIDEKPISQYMRGVMILYLEDIQNFKDECKDGETCHRVLGDVNDGEWDKTLDSLEDRIKINIHEPGDKIEQKLLENVRYAENAYLEGFQRVYLDVSLGRPREEDERKAQEWISIGATCYAEAHESALNGHTFKPSPDDCDAKIQAKVEKWVNSLSEADCKEDRFVWRDGMCHGENQPVSAPPQTSKQKRPPP